MGNGHSHQEKKSKGQTKSTKTSLCCFRFFANIPLNMRQARLRGSGHHAVHTMSRIVQRQYLIKDSEKEKLRDIIREQSYFTGLDIITMCLLDNHFHLLIEVPAPETIPELTVDELFKRLPYIYSDAKVKEFKTIFDQAAAIGDQDRIERMLAGFAKRMHDVSFFMKEVKQRFSQWYNRRNDRRGTLWEERYKSVLVEGSQTALMTMAAYIDLNPVRAGIVKRAEDYRWSGYGAAVGGDEVARKGLGRILDQSSRVSGDDFADNWKETAKLYRLWVYSEGVEITPDLEKGERGRKGFTHEELEAVERRDGKMPRARALLCRVRYFTDGAVLGSAAFVDEVFESNRSHFGSKRTSGARKMRGAKWDGLCVIRDLRKTVIS